MKTLKALKITSVLNGIFCLCCILSLACLAINRYGAVGEAENIIAILSRVFLCCWAINPVGFVSFIVCLTMFLAERKDPVAKQAIGLKWIWIFVWPVVTTVFYFVSIGLMVDISGFA